MTYKSYYPFKAPKAAALKTPTEANWVPENFLNFFRSRV